MLTPCLFFDSSRLTLHLHLSLRSELDKKNSSCWVHFAERTAIIISKFQLIFMEDLRNSVQKFDFIHNHLRLDGAVQWKRSKRRGMKRERCNVETAKVIDLWKDQKILKSMSVQCDRLMKHTETYGSKNLACQKIRCSCCSRLDFLQSSGFLRSM